MKVVPCIAYQQQPPVSQMVDVYVGVEFYFWPVAALSVRRLRAGQGKVELPPRVRQLSN